MSFETRLSHQVAKQMHSKLDRVTSGIPTQTPRANQWIHVDRWQGCSLFSVSGHKVK